MATWQYQHPHDRKPVVTTNKGYFVNTPSARGRNYRASEQRHTAILEDQDRKRFPVWIHDIYMNFQIGGSFAQSHRHREWYSRNFVQPRVTVAGQTPNEAEYGHLCEFIRGTQRKALRFNDRDSRMNTVKLTIPSGGTQEHRHTGHSLNGHISNINRVAERWVNAPEFQFEFIVATAYAGIYETRSSEPSEAKNRISVHMQIHNLKRHGGTVRMVRDPDPWEPLPAVIGGRPK